MRTCSRGLQRPYRAHRRGTPCAIPRAVGGAVSLPSRVCGVASAVRRVVRPARCCDHTSRPRPGTASLRGDRHGTADAVVWPAMFVRSLVLLPLFAACAGHATPTTMARLDSLPDEHV